MKKIHFLFILLSLLSLFVLMIIFKKNNIVDYYEDRSTVDMPNVQLSDPCNGDLLCNKPCDNIAGVVPGSKSAMTILTNKDNQGTGGYCNLRMPNKTCDNIITGADNYLNQPIKDLDFNGGLAYYSVRAPTEQPDEYYCLVPSNGFDTSKGGRSNSCENGYTCIPRNKQGEIDMTWNPDPFSFCGGYPDKDGNIVPSTQFNGFWQWQGRNEDIDKIPVEYQYCHKTPAEGKDGYSNVYCAMKLNGTLGKCVEDPTIETKRQQDPCEKNPLYC
jgi:hypothetical protein